MYGIILVMQWYCITTISSKSTDSSNTVVYAITTSPTFLPLWPGTQSEWTDKWNE